MKLRRQLRFVVGPDRQRLDRAGKPRWPRDRKRCRLDEVRDGDLRIERQATGAEEIEASPTRVVSGPGDEHAGVGLPACSCHTAGVD
jgi:hypothetical protein